MIADHPITVFGLVALIASQSDFRAVGHEATGSEGLSIAARLRPRLVLIDLWHAEEALEVTSRLQWSLPGANLVALSERKDRRHVEEMIAAGLLGYVLKSSCKAVLLRALRAVAIGDLYLDPDLAEIVVGAAGRPWHAQALQAP